MDTKQTNKDNMFDATYLVLQTNLSIWTANAVMTTAVGKLNTYITGISSTATAQGVVTTGVTDNKDSVKETLITNIMLNANAGLAYASTAGNLVLKAKCKLNESELAKSKEAVLVTIAQNVHDALLPVAAALAGYGASATTLGTLQTSTTSFSGLVGTPRSARTSSISATGTLAEQFTDTMEFLEDTMDPLMAQYKVSNAAFYNSYIAARVIVDSGHRTTVILKGFVYNSTSHALAHAKVTIVGNKHHKKITEADGHYKFTHLTAGTYTIQVEATGFVTQTKAVTVASPQTVETDFTMVAVGGTTGGGTTTGGTPPAPTA
jgi:carboxypeptidase family protein